MTGLSDIGEEEEDDQLIFMDSPSHLFPPVRLLFWFLTGLLVWSWFLLWFRFLLWFLVPGPDGPVAALRPCGASLRPKLLAVWPRWSERMWKMCLRWAG